MGYLMTCKYTIFASKIMISNPKSFSKLTKDCLMLTLNPTYLSGVLILYCRLKYSYFTKLKKKAEFTSSFCLITIQIDVANRERADYVSPSPHMPDCVTAKCPRDWGVGGRQQGWGRGGGVGKRSKLEKIKWERDLKGGSNESVIKRNVRMLQRACEVGFCHPS